MTTSREVKIVAASSTLVLVSGVGMSVGPTIAGAFMTVQGPQGLFSFIGIVHLSIGGFAVYRMSRRDAVPLEKQRSYGTLSPRTSPVGAAFAMDTLRDERDRDLARMSKL